MHWIYSHWSPKFVRYLIRMRYSCWVILLFSSNKENKYWTIFPIPKGEPKKCALVLWVLLCNNCIWFTICFEFMGGCYNTHIKTHKICLDVWVGCHNTTSKTQNTYRSLGRLYNIYMHLTHKIHVYNEGKKEKEKEKACKRKKNKNEEVTKMEKKKKKWTRRKNLKGTKLEDKRKNFFLKILT